MYNWFFNDRFVTDVDASITLFVDDCTARKLKKPI